MTKVCTLASGSSGNATLIECNGKILLIDAGIGIKVLQNRLASLGFGYENVVGIFITHEHCDHIKGLKTILKKHSIPVLACREVRDETLKTLPEECRGLLGVLPVGATAKNGDFSVTSFPCVHDSSACTGYRITTPDGSIGVATDLGEVSAAVRDHLNGCKVLVFEANYDEEMLKNGIYRDCLKDRISHGAGHLSNRASGEALCEFIRNGTERVFLAHLSENNNIPSLCEETVCGILKKAGLSATVTAAPRYEPSETYSL